MCDRHHFPRQYDCRHNRRQVLGLIGATVGAGVLAMVPLHVQAMAAVVDLPPPAPMDTCPVCGMFVAKYPEWIATIAFKDGHADHFDGAKDFFKYLLDMPKYAGGRVRTDIIGMGVTDYYDVKRIDAAQAVYVIGSDVLGPMGHELVPHANADDAQAFMKDHQGKRVLRFDTVTQTALVNLDEGIFEP